MRIIFCIVLLICSSVHAQQPIEVAQAQLDAYNNQNIEAFVSVFSENAEVYMDLGDSIPTMVGREEIKKRYGSMFEANPDNKSTLKGRMVQGNFVFDHEYITGRSTSFEIMAIYEVQDGMIVRCWFTR